MLNDFLELLKVLATLSSLQLLVLLLPFVLFIILIRFLKIAFEIVFPKVFGQRLYLLFASIGTPIHELSHVIMCLIFRHKVVRFSLFNPRPNGTLGYVDHDWNKKSIYQNLGLVFIGMAPAIFGSILIYILIRFLYPSFFILERPYFTLNDLKLFLNYEYVLKYFGMIYELFILKLEFLFSLETYKNWQIYALIFLLIAIGSHISPSRADFQGSLKSSILIIVFAFVFIIIINFLSFFGIINILPLLNKAGAMTNVLLLASIVNGFFLGFLFLLYLLKRLFIHFMKW
ncbi:MAG: hypothetical protein ABIA04_00690 [Pseudomonadota bacterium]